jgi:hypothetical protein
MSTGAHSTSRSLWRKAQGTIPWGASGIVGKRTPNPREPASRTASDAATAARKPARGLATPLADADEVFVLPAISGG